MKKQLLFILLSCTIVSTKAICQEQAWTTPGSQPAELAQLQQNDVVLLAKRLPKVAIKSNLLYDATTTFNLGAEFGLGNRTTLDISANYNPWTFKDNKKIKHYMIQPEIRMWSCERFNGGFWGFHLLGGNANFGGVKMPFGLYPQLKTNRFEAYFAGAGVSYGYQWNLGSHWNLEATAGVGFVYFDYKKFECAKCGSQIDKGTQNYFGPTKLGLSLVYLFNHKK